MRSPKDLPLFGGVLCLDFVNSLDWRGRAEPEEYLHTYADLLEWAVGAGALTQAQARPLHDAFTKREAAAALQRAIEFREAAYRVLRAALARKSAPDADLRRINSVTAQARGGSQIRQTRQGFSWNLPEGKNPDIPLSAVALSLSDLLTGDDLQHVRLCGGPECGWLFLDTSKNQKRRWCSMQGCGNRAKARRHYSKTR
ncbi:MAG TPA: ABATE domain-containing protein [Candidatus Rubrimentiphilum sp.]|nr:ABATE domain-containing protein [Candidatus Rubrimentiphilum sp.]